MKQPSYRYENPIRRIAGACRHALCCWSLLLRRPRRSSMPRGRPMTPVAPPPRGRRGGRRWKGVQRAVTSEVAGLTAFETGNYHGRGLYRPPHQPIRRETASRTTARANTRTVRVWCRYLHRAPFDGHLPHQIKNFLWFVLPGPSQMLNLEFEVGGIQPCHQRFTNDGCRTSFVNTQRVTENAFSTGIFKVLFKAAVDGFNPIYSRSFGPHGHPTAHLSRRSRWVDRIVGQTFRASQAPRVNRLPVILSHQNKSTTGTNGWTDAAAEQPTAQGAR